MTSDLPNQRNCLIKRLAFVKFPRTPELLLYNMQNVFKELQLIQCFQLELCTKGQYLPSHPTFTTSSWKIHNFHSVERFHTKM